MCDLECKVREAESDLSKATEEAGRLEERVAEVTEREKHSHLMCQQLQDKVQAMSRAQESLHAKHLAEVRKGGKGEWFDARTFAGSATTGGA